MPAKKSAVLDTAAEHINETMPENAPEMVEDDVAAQEKKAVQTLPVAYDGLASLPDTFEAVMAEMGDFYGAKLPSFNPYPLLRDKSKLLDIEFIIERFDFITKKDGSISYVNVKAITRQGNRRFAFNDGGTGVCAQLVEFQEKTGRNGGIHCPLGLRVSEYVSEKTGEDAKTYYLN